MATETPLLEELIPGKSVFAAKFEKLEDIKENALVGLDANVLLLPYQMGQASHKEIEQVYRRLAVERRLIVPSQAATEFAAHRSSKLGELARSLRDQSSRIIAPAAKRIRFLEDDEAYKKVLALSEQIENCKQTINKEVGKIVRRLRDEVGDDPVSRLYRELFVDAVAEVDIDATAFAEELAYRYKHRLPPGYKDAEKPDGGRGDLIIWKTILMVGKNANAHFIFVTGDEKQDWYVQSEGAFQPRPELLFEYFKETSGKTLHLISLSKLLDLFMVDRKTVEDAKEAEQIARMRDRQRLEADRQHLEMHRRHLRQQLEALEAEMAVADERLDSVSRAVAAGERGGDIEGAKLEILQANRLAAVERLMATQQELARVQGTLAAIEDRLMDRLHALEQAR